MPTLPSAVERFVDRVVPIGYSRLGYLLRRRSFSPTEPVSTDGVAVVTGASSGIGMATAAGLAKLGARVVMVVRDFERGSRARAGVLSEVPGAAIDLSICDIADFGSVRALGRELARRYPRIDILVHNAGVLPGSRKTSPDGHELTLATHVLGPLLLTELLRVPLAASGDARVIFVSSGGMYSQRLRADDPEYVRGEYRGAAAYARTKRMQVALSQRLARRYADAGISVHATHPGWVDTPGVADSMPRFYRITGPLLRTPEQGADTITWLAATRSPLPSGLFWHDRRIRPTHYLPTTRDSEDDRTRLWRYCATAVGLEDTR